MYETKRKKSFSLGKRAIFDRFMREKKKKERKKVRNANFQQIKITNNAIT